MRGLWFGINNLCSGFKKNGVQSWGDHSSPRKTKTEEIREIAMLVGHGPTDNVPCPNADELPGVGQFLWGEAPSVRRCGSNTNPTTTSRKKRPGKGNGTIDDKKSTFPRIKQFGVNTMHRWQDQESHGTL